MSTYFNIYWIYINFIRKTVFEIHRINFRTHNYVDQRVQGGPAHDGGGVPGRAAVQRCGGEQAGNWRGRGHRDTGEPTLREGWGEGSVHREDLPSRIQVRETAVELYAAM